MQIAGRHRRVLGARSFLLEIEGISNAAFSRCLGLEARADVLEYVEGGTSVARQLRGDVRYGPLLLERGIGNSRDLFQWFQNGEPRDGAVILISPSGGELMRWEFLRGWPCGWDGPALDASVDTVALERLEVVHEGLRWLPC